MARVPLDCACWKDDGAVIVNCVEGLLNVYSVSQIWCVIGLRCCGIGEAAVRVPMPYFYASALPGDAHAAFGELKFSNS